MDRRSFGRRVLAGLAAAIWPFRGRAEFDAADVALPAPGDCSLADCCCHCAGQDWDGRWVTIEVETADGYKVLDRYFLPSAVCDAAGGHTVTVRTVTP